MSALPAPTAPQPRPNEGLPTLQPAARPAGVRESKESLLVAVQAPFGKLVLSPDGFRARQDSDRLLKKFEITAGALLVPSLLGLSLSGGHLYLESQKPFLEQSHLTRGLLAGGIGISAITLALSLGTLIAGEAIKIKSLPVHAVLQKDGGLLLVDHSF